MKMRVLIVEDNVGLRSLLASGIQIMGHSVTESGNADGATVFLGYEEFDLAFIDNDLSKVDDGLRIVNHARGLPCPPYMVWMSGRADNHDLAGKALDAGADEIMPKPLDPRRIRSIIERVASRKYLAEAADPQEILA